MKEKTARRWINRNRWKIAESQGNNKKINRQFFLCLKTISEQKKENKKSVLKAVLTETL